MTTVRSAKNKGSAFEADARASLKPIYSDIIRMGMEGYQCMQDLRSESQRTVFECKRLKGISWNQLVKFYEKLQNIMPEWTAMVLFKSNNQPCLVFLKTEAGYMIRTFEDHFGTPFVKHPSSRIKSI